MRTLPSTNSINCNGNSISLHCQLIIYDNIRRGQKIGIDSLYDMEHYELIPFSA